MNKHFFAAQKALAEQAKDYAKLIDLMDGPLGNLSGPVAVNFVLGMIDGMGRMDREAIIDALHPTPVTPKKSNRPAKAKPNKRPDGTYDSQKGPLYLAIEKVLPSFPDDEPDRSAIYEAVARLLTIPPRRNCFSLSLKAALRRRQTEADAHKNPALNGVIVTPGDTEGVQS